MVRITKAEMKKLRQEFPLRYFHGTKHRIYMEERPSANKALKILRAAVCVVLLMLTLTACGRKDTTAVIYQDNSITVCRNGRCTTVSDAISGAEYHFTAHRIRKPQTAEEAAQRAIAKTAVDTDELAVMTVRNEIIVFEKGTGKTVVIR